MVPRSHSRLKEICGLAGYFQPTKEPCYLEENSMFLTLDTEGPIWCILRVSLILVYLWSQTVEALNCYYNRYELRDHTIWKRPM